MSSYVDFWEMCYTNKWVSLDMVKQACNKGIITTDEFKAITAMDYIA